MAISFADAQKSAAPNAIQYYCIRFGQKKSDETPRLRVIFLSPAYVAIAARLKIPLVTLDHDKGTKAAGRVAILAPTRSAV
jgi:hypothetical protein